MGRRIWDAWMRCSQECILDSHQVCLKIPPYGQSDSTVLLTSMLSWMVLKTECWVIISNFHHHVQTSPKRVRGHSTLRCLWSLENMKILVHFLSHTCDLFVWVYPQDQNVLDLKLCVKNEKWKMKIVMAKAPPRFELGLQESEPWVMTNYTKEPLLAFSGYELLASTTPRNIDCILLSTKQQLPSPKREPVYVFIFQLHVYNLHI